jgi:uncharacterized protein
MLEVSSIEPWLAQVVTWASARADVLAVGLVGSHARGAATEDSDVDLVLVVECTAGYLSDAGWLESFGSLVSVRDEDHGLVQSRRARYVNGLEVEWGLADRRWTHTQPLDGPTADVIAAGMRILHDPHGLLQRLSQAVAER